MARAKGRLRGRQPKLKPNQAKDLVELYDLGTYSHAELAELFGVSRSTIHRTLERTRPRPPRTPSNPSPHRGRVSGLAGGGSQPNVQLSRLPEGQPAQPSTTASRPDYRGPAAPGRRSDDNRSGARRGAVVQAALQARP